MKENQTCCIFGHRTILETEKLNQDVLRVIEALILQKKTDTFLFGSKGRFNAYCLEKVSEMKEKYPHIKRVYVRAEYPYINDSYREFLLKRYDDTYYPEKLMGAGKAVYVERNFEMIDRSRYCICTTMRKTDLRNTKAEPKLLLTMPSKKERKLYCCRWRKEICDRVSFQKLCKDIKKDRKFGLFCFFISEAS